MRKCRQKHLVSRTWLPGPCPVNMCQLLLLIVILGPLSMTRPRSLLMQNSNNPTCTFKKDIPNSGSG